MSAIFQHIRDEMMWNLVDHGVVGYIDNILIYAENKDEYI
jgi:hypothetical protein